MELSKLPNIGPQLAMRLEAVGFKDEDDLKNAGSQQAFLALLALDPSTCINTLYALEGAVRGIRWHGLSKTDKQKLLDFYNITKLGIK
jgi:DNA transformation protein